MNRTTSIRRNARGFTLVELCAGIGIGAALLGQAVPAMSKMQQQQKLRAQSELLASDLRLARSEAVRTMDPVYFRISGKGTQACYVLYTGVRNDCDCAGGRAVCRTPESAVIKAEWLPSRQAMTLSSNAETLEFQHRQGLVTQTGSIELALGNGTGIRQVVAITGRVRHCATGAQIAGIKKCA